MNTSIAPLKKRLIEEALEAEQTELVCCRYHGRSTLRRDSRTGSWKRFLLLKDGCLELKVPPPRYMQRTPEIDEALHKGFLFGAPTRRCGQALSALRGDKKFGFRGKGIPYPISP